MKWSPMQRDIFQAVESSARNLVIEACPGSGKTTTLVEALGHTDAAKSAAVLAFNKSIATELQSRLPGDIEALTFHSLGFAALRRAGIDNVDTAWLPKMVSTLVGRGPTRHAYRQFVNRLIGHAKAQLTDIEPEALMELAYNVGLFAPEDASEQLIAMAIRLLDQSASGDAPLNFDDMIWLPNILNVPTTQFDIIGVDEAQDLNAAQFALLDEARAENGRVIAVGDRKQSIYEFRGAGANAMPDLVKYLDAQVLPLSITYRCPEAVVAHANGIYPGSMSVAAHAPKGVVLSRTYMTMLENARDGDFIVSRSNAALLRVALKLLQRGTAFSLAGKDVLTELKSFVTERANVSLTEFAGMVDAWEDSELGKLPESAQSAANIISDKAECLRALIDQHDIKTTADIVQTLNELQQQGGAVQLLTTHKAKGLEADRVWVLRSTYTTDSYQERNMLYVAVTRAKRELYLIGSTR